MTTWIEEQLEPHKHVMQLFFETSTSYTLTPEDASRIGAKLDEVLKEKDAEIDFLQGTLNATADMNLSILQDRDKVLLEQDAKIAHLREIVAAADRLRDAPHGYFRLSAEGREYAQARDNYNRIRQPAPESLPDMEPSLSDTGKDPWQEKASWVGRSWPEVRLLPTQSERLEALESRIKEIEGRLGSFNRYLDRKEDETREMIRRMESRIAALEAQMPKRWK